jgi:hypothetical protein
MTATQIRQRLREYIDTAEEKKLKAIYTLLQDDMPGNINLTNDQQKILDKRMADHEAGIGRTYSWEETVAIAQQALKSQK